jgi:hypothetical protein
MHFCKRNNIQDGGVFCATEITMFSTLSSFMESHFGTADKWDVYADSFMTHKLLFLVVIKHPIVTHTHTHTPECLEASAVTVWERNVVCVCVVCMCVCVCVCV